MPCDLVKRTFPDGLVIPATNACAQACLGVVAVNAENGVTWIASISNCTVTLQQYIGPSATAIGCSAGGPV